MGWTFSTQWPDKSAMIKHLCDEQVLYTTIAKCVRGSALYAVHEAKSKASGSWTRIIAVYVLGSDVKRGGGWGYKDMDESMGPTVADCPPKYFELVPEVPNEYASAWRMRCIENAQRKSVKLHVGDRIKLRPNYTVEELVVVSVKPLRAKPAAWLNSNATYALKRSMIASVVPVAQEGHA